MSHTRGPVVEPPVDRSDDDRLRQLLAVEQRLQDLVRAAQEDAGRRIATARAESDRRLAAAREAAKADDMRRAEVERVSQAAALEAIRAAHQATLVRIHALTEERVDELARWAVEQAVGGSGEST